MCFVLIVSVYHVFLFLSFWTRPTYNYKWTAWEIFLLYKMQFSEIQCNETCCCSAPIRSIWTRTSSCSSTLTALLCGQLRYPSLCVYLIVCFFSSYSGRSSTRLQPISTLHSDSLWRMLVVVIIRSHCRPMHTVHKMRPVVTDVARGVVCMSSCVSVCWAHGWAVHNRLSQSRWTLGADTRWSKGPYIRFKVGRIHSQPWGWETSDAAFCQFFYTCFYYTTTPHSAVIRGPSPGNDSCIDNKLQDINKGDLADNW